MRKTLVFTGILTLFLAACQISVDLPPVLGFLGTDTPTPTYTPTATATFTPTATFTSTFTPTTTPTPTNTSTFTPSPTSTPRPVQPSGGTGGSGSSGEAGGGTGGGTSGCLQTNGGYVSQIISLVNAERRAAGMPELNVNWTLVANSQSWSEYMATSGYWGHSGQNVGENIAAGQGSPAEAVADWMSSDGHRANILNYGYTQVGAGYAFCSSSQYGHYWTIQFLP